jgi:hypothetical protein
LKDKSTKENANCNQFYFVSFPQQGTAREEPLIFASKQITIISPEEGILPVWGQLRVHEIQDFHLSQRIPKSEETGNKSADGGNGDHSNVLAHCHPRSLRASPKKAAAIVQNHLSGE